MMSVHHRGISFDISIFSKKTAKSRLGKSFILKLMERRKNQSSGLIMGNPEDQQQNDYSDEMDIVKNPVVRVLFIIVGSLFVGIGIIGLLLPLLPGVPFLIAAAYLYSRSSERFYVWLMTNRYFGSTIRDYRRGQGIPMKVKAYAIATLWTVILISVLVVLPTASFSVPIHYIQAAFILMATLVSWHLLSLPTKKPIAPRSKLD